MCAMTDKPHACRSASCWAGCIGFRGACQCASLSYVLLFSTDAPGRVYDGHSRLSPGTCCLWVNQSSCRLRLGYPLSAGARRGEALQGGVTPAGHAHGSVSAVAYSGRVHASRAGGQQSKGRGAAGREAAQARGGRAAGAGAAAAGTAEGGDSEPSYVYAPMGETRQYRHWHETHTWVTIQSLSAAGCAPGEQLCLLCRDESWKTAAAHTPPCANCRSAHNGGWRSLTRRLGPWTPPSPPSWPPSRRPAPGARPTRCAVSCQADKFFSLQPSAFSLQALGNAAFAACKLQRLQGHAGLACRRKVCTMCLHQLLVMSVSSLVQRTLRPTACVHDYGCWQAREDAEAREAALGGRRQLLSRLQQEHHKIAATAARSAALWLGLPFRLHKAVWLFDLQNAGRALLLPAEPASCQ